MGRQLHTIYELLNEYTEEQIDYAISQLEMEYQLIIFDRYGSDLHHPKTIETWNKERSYQFYRKVIPKLKQILKELYPNVKNDLQGQNEDHEYFQILIDLLKQNKSTDEICAILNIDVSKFHEDLRILKSKGVKYYTKYYSSGMIKYFGVQNIQELKKTSGSISEKILITEESENKIKVMTISDMHIGNDLERIDLLNRVYNYAAKSGINVILCTGDILDGTYTKGSQRIVSPFEQIEYFIKKYPFDKNILNFAVAGDHDESILHTLSLDLASALELNRPDFVVMGYGSANLLIKNDKIHLYHRVPGVKYDPLDAAISFVGHSHKYMVDNSASYLKVNLPTLSNIINLMPTALEVELSFNKGYISSAIVKQVYFGEQDLVLSELYYDLTKGRMFDVQGIKNVENFRGINDDAVTLKRVSQIEKFNKKYSK